ncbi:unnamed protein product [Linum tenue]|uniref:Uncharacterized protein n=1 Tax=Linum tenue TaxID=586396 RepID=A0AAV0H5V7_9ROSI|nr:unnamed protein product [Linum tenue]
MEAICSGRRSGRNTDRKKNPPEKRREEYGRRRRCRVESERGKGDFNDPDVVFVFGRRKDLPPTIQALLVATTMTRGELCFDFHFLMRSPFSRNLLPKPSPALTVFNQSSLSTPGFQLAGGDNCDISWGIYHPLYTRF